MRFRYQIGEGPPLMLAPLPETPVLRKPPASPPPKGKRPPARQRRVPALNRLAAAGLLAAAVGCATPEPRTSKAWTIEPQIGVTHAMQAGDAYYRLGRYHDDTQEWGKAALAYRKAIAADAQSIEAYNALGVALARTGRHAEAEATLRQAVALAPDRAHVRNNLGYVLLLAGKPSAAIGELEAAVALDAGDTVARANLHDALARSGAGRSGSDAPAERPALPPAVLPLAEAAVLPLAEAAVLHLAEAAAPPPVRPPRLEISNGNGVAGMAAKVGRWLATHQGMRTDRLTNQKPFVQRDTIVQYREGHAEAAARMARALPLAAQPAAEPSKGLSGDLRVVLGRDWARSAACLDRGSCPARDAGTQLAQAQAQAQGAP